jgi:hypothetical protein
MPRLSVTSADHHRLFGPASFAMTAPAPAAVLQRVCVRCCWRHRVKVGVEAAGHYHRLAALGVSRFVRFAANRGLLVRRSISVSPDAWRAEQGRLVSPGRQSGLLAACQSGLGSAPVRRSSAATSRSLVLVCWQAWVRMVNASSSLILCRSIKMPLACSMQARDIIALRS